MADFVVQFVNVLVYVLYFALLGRVIVSWLAAAGMMSPGNPIFNALYQITEPILAPIRRVLPSTGMIDLSPMIAILILALIQVAIAQLA